MKRVFVAMSVAAFIFLGTSGAVSAQDGSGQDYVTLLDKFMVDGPGAAEPGWFDDFDDGDLGDWICWWGTCQDVPGTTYARFESPGEVVGYAGLPVSYEESSVGSWIIPESYVSGEEWFQGVAIFAAELPHANESIFLGLSYGPFDWDGNGTMVYESIGVFIEITSPAIATIFGNPTVGLQLQQGRGVFDENWNIISYSEWDSEQLTAPNALGNVVLSIRYHEGPEGFVYHAGYSLTGSLDVVEPFSPMESHLHLSGVPGIWGIGAHVDFLNADIDIKPGSDPNCFNLNGHGVIPVAINGSADLDVYYVDMDTLLFGGLQARARGNKGPLCSIKDWNDDGFADLVCHFEDDPGNWTGGESTATLTGYMLDGTSFTGTDSICVVP